MKPLLRKPIATFYFDPRKTWPFMIMLGAMMLLGLARIWEYGLAEDWASAFILILIPGIALVMIGQEVLSIRGGPVVVIAEDGLIDRRRGPEPLHWDAVQQATIKRRLFAKGIRIVLTDGERYDIELNLLRADPLEVMKLIQETAHRAVGDGTADR